MRLSNIVALCAFAMSCSDPKCPIGFVQMGMICHRCAEGTEKVGNSCVSTDGDDDDQDAQTADTPVDNGASEVGDEGESDGGGGSTDGGPSVTVADAGGQTCFLDRDKDGVGSGKSVDCGSGDVVDALGARLSQLGNDCDDNDAERSPRLTDICGDNVDNDCDGRVDDESNNACGGPCTMQLQHQPGEGCDNGLVGACIGKGVYKCDGMMIRCSASAVNPGMEICGDSVDNDCDGSTDEPDAINATVWYQDCDGDGFAASLAGATRACNRPADVGACGWTNVVPQPETKSNWDCNDANKAYSPGTAYGFPPSGSTSWDLNCDGQTLPDPEFWPTSKKVCVTSISDWFTLGRPSCPTQYAVDGCFVFKNASGGFSRPGSTVGFGNAGGILACPDVPYLVTLNQDSGTCELSTNPQPSMWPCK